MSLREDFKNIISELSHEELIKIATDGILANVYFVKNKNKYIYCFTYRDFDNVTYAITDNEIELSNFIYNQLLGNCILSDNIILFPMNRDDIDEHEELISQFPTYEQCFRCYPGNINNWCNRSIKNKKPFIDWIIKYFEEEEEDITDEINKAIHDNSRYYVGGGRINDYIEYVFNVKISDWYPII